VTWLGGLCNQGIAVRIPGASRVQQNVKTGCGVRRAPNRFRTGRYPGGKSAGAWGSPLTLWHTQPAVRRSEPSMSLLLVLAFCQ
jgi:hypothetical protein